MEDILTDHFNFRKSNVFRSMLFSLYGLFIAMANCCGQEVSVTSDSIDEFEKAIRPLLERYCIDCHSHEGNTAEFLWPRTAAEATRLRNSFASVSHRMKDGTMPPADSDQPTLAERETINSWIDKTFDLTPNDFDRLSSYVVEAFEDSKGNLWFGTVSEGAARFDGKSLQWFSTRNGLAGDTVVSIAEDASGNIWLGTEGGVVKFDGKVFTNYSTEAGLPGTRCYILIDRKGTLWAGTERGVFRFNGSKFTPFDIPEPEIQKRTWKVGEGKVWSLMEDRKGNIWIGRDGLGACRFDGTSFQHFTKREGLCSNNVSSIVEDKQGHIWFGCLSSGHPTHVLEGGLNRFDGKAITRFAETKGLLNNDIYTIYATKGGNLWIGATGVGVYRYDGKTFSLFDKTDRPYWTRYLGLQSMLEDRKGELWFGFSGGLFRFDGESFFNVGKSGPWGRQARKK